MKENIKIIIKNKIIKKEEIPPFLFVWDDLVRLDYEIRNITKELFEEFKIDKNNLWVIEDNWESIKIEEARILQDRSFKKANFIFQIFHIKNISRFTPQAANSLLKFFEEPWFGNIIFLTNTSESNVLETILSRVHTVNVFSNVIFEKNNIYRNMIDDYINNNKIDILSYLMNEKLEKKDYILFLKNIIFYIKEKSIYVDLLDEIEDSINKIEKNNVLAKYQLDKILLMMK